ncbi:MAG: hypothetical protein IPK82_10060 [Polyangiaceae bacterium]|nr:hypothetical protein [Polyangiaceae bacterium]
MGSTFRERQLPPAEVRRVLRTAATLAETDPNNVGVERALSEEELVAAAAQLGLSPEVVRRAIAKPAASPPEKNGPWVRSRLVVHEEEILGHVPEDRYEEVLDAIRKTAGVQGRVESVGKSISWAMGPAHPVIVSMKVRGNSTVVRVEEKLNGGALLAGLSSLAIFPGLVTGGLTMDLAHSAPMAWLFGLAAFLLTMLAMSALARRNVHKRETLLWNLMEQTTAAVRNAVEAPAGELRARPMRVDSGAYSQQEKRIAEEFLPESEAAITEAAEAEAAQTKSARG